MLDIFYIQNMFLKLVFGAVVKLLPFLYKLTRKLQPLLDLTNLLFISTGKKKMATDLDIKLRFLE